MGTSMIDVQRDIILDTLRQTTQGDWKVLVVDEDSRKILDNTVKEDDILNQNITNIDRIEDRRPRNADIDAIYLLSPEQYVVDCLMADLEARRYRKAFLLWTGLLDSNSRSRIDKSQNARDQIADFRVLNINYYPRESRVVVFRDPWSFPVLYHPACNNLVRAHLEKLSQAIVSVCVSLGEYPSVRYYRPREPRHEASVLCSHLARFVQDELDTFARYHRDFPPPSPRPRSVLLLTDRTMDMFSPLIHEFTYQAMALDVLPVVDGDQLKYKYISNPGRPNEENKEVSITENDKIWVSNRHMHMKDLLEKLVSDFNKFRADNPHFAEDNEESTTSVNAIKDMLVGLSGFQEGKEGFALHLEMAEKCVKIFQDHKLLDVGAVEQTLSTGLDEDYKRPRNVADQVVRLLDDDNVDKYDRLRLILLYAMYRNGILANDIQKLLSHAQLPPQDGEVVNNLDLLGVRVTKPLKDTAPPPQPVIALKQPTTQMENDNTLSRFEPVLKSILQEQVRGTLDQNVFPFTKLDPSDSVMGLQNDSQASLRSAKPTWARTRPSANEPRQRLIVFMAGGATYAESRACYEVSQAMGRDVILTTSHMLNPKLFMRQVGDLSVDKRRLDLPSERGPRKAPAHLFEQSQTMAPTPSPQPVKPTGPPQGLPGGLPQGPKRQAPPTAAMASMNLGPPQPVQPQPRPPNGSFVAPTDARLTDTGKGGKLVKKDKDKDKKKHRFF